MENVLQFIIDNKLQGNAYRVLLTIMHYQLKNNYNSCPNSLLLKKLQLQKTALSKCIVDMRKLGIIQDTEQGKRKYFSVNWAITNARKNPGNHPNQQYLKL